MCRPLLSITAWHLLLHERINVLHSSADIFSRSPFKLVHSSSTFLGFFSLALSLSNFQTFSIGFMSGICAGHSVTVTSSSKRNVLTDFAVWHGTLSFINIAGLIAVLKLGTCFFNISLYTVALILPCSLTRGSVPAVAEIIPTPSHFLLQISRCFSVLKRISFLKTVSNEPSLATTEQVKLDSSLKWTQSHCSSVHMTCLVANFNRLILFFLEM